MGSEVVLMWLAQGVVAYIGGRIMAGIVGDPTVANIDAIVRAAVIEINAFTRKAIDENEIRKLVASMDSVLRNLRDFSLLVGHRDQLANEFLLTDAILKTGESISQSRSLGISAIFCYVNSVSLNLLARAAYYKLTGTSASAQLIAAMVLEAKQTIALALPPFEESWEPARRISVPNPSCLWDRGQGDEPIGKCWVLVDGNKKEVFDGIGPISSGEYQQFVDAELTLARSQQTQAVAAVEGPVRRAIEQWDNALASTNLKFLPMA